MTHIDPVLLLIGKSVPAPRPVNARHLSIRQVHANK